MNIILKAGLCFFLLFAAGLSTQAEEQAKSAQNQSKPEKTQYYIVEVILFRHLNEQGKNDEYWDRPDIFNNSIDNNERQQDILTDDSPALAEYNLGSKRFTPLRNGIAATSAEKYKLADSAAHLRYSPNYKVLAHFGWTQRSISRKRALPVRITSNQFSDSLIPHGEIKLYVSRFLHMQVDLKASQCEYSKPVANEISDQALDEQLEKGLSKLEIDKTIFDEQCINKVYRFKQNRKMRSKELHYIDNPAFGLLVYVTPFSVGG